MRSKTRNLLTEEETKKLVKVHFGDSSEAANHMTRKKAITQLKKLKKLDLAILNALNSIQKEI